MPKKTGLGVLARLRNGANDGIKRLVEARPVGLLKIGTGRLAQACGAGYIKVTIVSENSAANVKSRSSALNDERLVITAWIATAVIAAFLGLGQVGASWALLVPLLANASVVAAGRLHWETAASLTLRRHLLELQASGKKDEFHAGSFVEAAKVRLAEAGVRFRDLGSKTIPNRLKWESAVEGYPRPSRYRLVGEPDQSALGTVEKGQP